MPSMSGREHRAMAAAAAGHSNLGIPKDVGQEFINADKGRHFKDAESEPPEISQDALMATLDKLFDYLQILTFKVGQMEERRK